MKYLKLYEAFKSRGISNTLNFLQQKIGKKSRDLFLKSLQGLIEVVDLPIDKISDSDIKYMSAKKAIDIKKEENVTNKWGIWVIKYWFSLEDGFLGFSATGNEKKEYLQQGSQYREQAKFNEPDLGYIKTNITKTGEIWPVSDYSKLKTGDIVLGLFSGENWQRDRISLARIFKDDYEGRIYAIQGVSDGSAPSSGNWRNYTQFGGLSWFLASEDDIASDHFKLNYWRQSEGEISYIENPASKEEEKSEDPLTYNLPLNNRYGFSSWHRGSSIKKEDFDKADFALVLYFDDLLNDVDSEFYERPSDVRQKRSQEKEGALKLMTDDEIKKMNIERYIQKISNSLKISETEFYNLEKIVNKHLANEFSFISIYLQSPNWSNIFQYANFLYDVVDNAEKEYYINRCKQLFSDKTREYYKTLLQYQKNKKCIKNKTFLDKILSEIFQIGRQINIYFISKELNSIDDLWSTVKKIHILHDFMKMSRNLPSDQLRECFSNIRHSDFEIIYKDLNSSYTETIYQSDLEKIRRVKTFIESL